MTACVTGCTSLGRHMSHCDDEDCRGCMPRETELGNVCGRCWSNLQRDVRTAPSIVDWIREHVEPSSQWGERVNSKEIDAPAPLGINAVDDADELHAQLASWALFVMEQLGLNPPAPRRQRRGHDGTVVGLLPDSDATTSIARFLATHLEWCVGQDWAGAMVQEVGSTVRTLLARYPHAERARHLPDARCPVCERSSMVYHPPAWVGSDVLVQCDHNDCGCIIPEDRYGLFMAMVAEDRKRELEESA